MELPMTWPPETEKLLSCNLLRQVTCRHLQMIFLNIFSVTQLINLVKVKVAIGKGGKCWKNPRSEINGIHWDVSGSCVVFQATSIAVGGWAVCGEPRELTLADLEEFEAKNGRRIYEENASFYSWVFSCCLFFWLLLCCSVLLRVALSFSFLLLRVLMLPLANAACYLTVAHVVSLPIQWVFVTNPISDVDNQHGVSSWNFVQWNIALQIENVFVFFQIENADRKICFTVIYLVFFLNPEFLGPPPDRVRARRCREC